MSTLQKTINMLKQMSERQIESIYSYVQFVHSQQATETRQETENIDDILDHIIGVVPDTGKSLEEYQEERIRERYGLIN